METAVKAIGVSADAGFNGTGRVWKLGKTLFAAQNENPF